MSAADLYAGEPAVRLRQVHSGLLARWDFRQAESLSDLAVDFEFSGSAAAELRYARSTRDGLEIGVLPHEPAEWCGFFALPRVSFPATSVFHVRMARDKNAVWGPDRSGESVFAVQTASTKRTGILNYILAASSTSRGRTHWLVGQAKGLESDAALTVLWNSPAVPSAGADQVQDISLRTDGVSTLQAWFGEQLVYAGDDLHLEVEPPLQPYLEVQAQEIGYATSFTDYWVTEDDMIEINGLNPGEEVSLVQCGGQITRATAAETGRARLALHLPVVRGAGRLTVHRGNGLSFGPLTYAGGDAYRLVQ